MAVKDEGSMRVPLGRSLQWKDGVPLAHPSPAGPQPPPISPVPCFIKGAQCVPCSPASRDVLWQQMQERMSRRLKELGTKEHIRR